MKEEILDIKEIEKMTDYDFVNLIIEELNKKGFKVTQVDYTGRPTVSARKAYEEIQVSYEMCMCHGGRIWISTNHTDVHYEISHNSYDTALGIVSPETELFWEIKNELGNKIEQLSHTVYKLCVINRYGKVNGIDQEDITYFADMESITQYLFFMGDYSDNVKEIKDYNTILEEITMQCANSRFKYTIKPLDKKSEYSWEQNRKYFENEYTRLNIRYAKDVDMGLSLSDNEYLVLDLK